MSGSEGMPGPVDQSGQDGVNPVPDSVLSLESHRHALPRRVVHGRVVHDRPVLVPPWLHHPGYTRPYRTQHWLPGHHAWRSRKVSWGSIMDLALAPRRMD